VRPQPRRSVVEGWAGILCDSVLFYYGVANLHHHEHLLDKDGQIGEATDLLVRLRSDSRKPGFRSRGFSEMRTAPVRHPLHNTGY
jgi:hypothetical protein